MNIIFFIFLIFKKKLSKVKYFFLIFWRLTMLCIITGKGHKFWNIILDNIKYESWIIFLN